MAADDVAGLLAELDHGLREWRDPEHDAAVLASTYPATTLYHGKHVDAAPDLVIGYAAGYSASWQTALGATPAGELEDNRLAWSGDHCIEASLVPGVLLSNRAIPDSVHGIADVGAWLLTLAGAVPAISAPPAP